MKKLTEAQLSFLDDGCVVFERGAGYQTRSCTPSRMPVQPSFLSSSPPLICISHLILKVDLSFLPSFFSHHGVVKCLKIEVRDFCLDLLHPCRKECAAAASVYKQPFTQAQSAHTHQALDEAAVCVLPSAAPKWSNRMLNSAPLSLIAIFFLKVLPFIVLSLTEHTQIHPEVYMVVQKRCCRITPQWLQWRGTIMLV